MAEKFDLENYRSIWSRRRFMQNAGLGGGALLLAAQGQTLAQVIRQTQGGARGQGRPGQRRPVPGGAAARVGGVSPSEAKLHSLAGRDPALHAVLADALSYTKYSFAVAVAGGAQGGANELVADSRKFLATRKPKARAAYEESIKAILASPQIRQAQFGRFAEVSPTEFASRDRASLVKQVQPARVQMTSGINVALLKQAGYAHINPEDTGAGAAAVETERNAAQQRRQQQEQERRYHQQDLAAGAPFKHIEFRILRSRCIEQSGGALEGNNEIAFGGTAIGASNVVHKVQLPFHLEGVHTGGVFDLPPERQVFFTFDIFKDPFPRAYTVTILMSELDDGGFGDFLQSLWDKVGEFVSGAIADAIASTSLGTAIGSVIPGLGTAIGAVVGALIGWLISLFHNEDDFVGTETAVLEMHGAGRSNYDRGGLDSPLGLPVTLDFHDDGHFQLDCAFRAIPA